MANFEVNWSGERYSLCYGERFTSWRTRREDGYKQRAQVEEDFLQMFFLPIPQNEGASGKNLEWPPAYLVGGV